jgi:hypothetical protein
MNNHYLAVIGFGLGMGSERGIVFEKGEGW